MFYLTPTECSAFGSHRKWQPDFETRSQANQGELRAISFLVPPERDRLFSFCHLLFEVIPLSSDEECLLWSINTLFPMGDLQLYYRLRQSYGDFRQLSDAPGHLFSGYESNDLITFLQLFLLFGWDFHCLPKTSSCGAYHDDELMVLYFDEPKLLEHAKIKVTDFGIKWRDGI